MSDRRKSKEKLSVQGIQNNACKYGSYHIGSYSIKWAFICENGEQGRNTDYEKVCKGCSAVFYGGRRR